MTLDGETIDALSAPSRWDEYAFLFAVHRREQNARSNAGRIDTRRGRARKGPVASPLSTTQRREARRRHNLGHSVAVIARSIGATVPATRAYLATGRAAA